MDSGVAEGDRVNAQFDSLIAKLIVWGPDRAAAVARLSAALADFTILGCTTNLPLLQAITAHRGLPGRAHPTGWIQQHLAALNAPLAARALPGLLRSQAFREALSCALRGLGRPRPAPPSASRPWPTRSCAPAAAPSRPSA